MTDPRTARSWSSVTSFGSFVGGPGTVREIDEHHKRTRSVSCEASSRLTDRQLIARLRHLASADPRRTVGAFRWTEPLPDRPSGKAQLPPRRVFDKPPRQLDRGEP